MANLKSNSVEVYPSTRRDTSYQKTSRMFNERNAIAPIKHLAENSSYVITTEFDANGAFEFVIDGYYFKINPARVLIEDAGTSLKIFGYIILDTMNAITELYGVDDPTTSLYTGLNIVNNTVPNNSSASLLLLSRETSSGSWTIPNKSTIRYSRNTIDIDIDGGIISQ